MEAEPPSLSIFLSTNVLLYASVGLFFLVLLLFLSALVSGSEVAFFSINGKDLAKEEEDKPLRRIQKLLRDKKKLLASILVFNNFVNIAIVLLATYLSETYIHPFFGEVEFLGISMQLVFDVVVITFLLLLFGEIIPKVYATKSPISFAKFSSPLIQAVQALARPIAFPLLALSHFLEEKLKPATTISVDHLSQALELTSEDETTTQEEQKILEGIVNFGATETRQIMTPRVDVFSLSLALSFAEVVQKVAEKGYSRIPVYGTQVDDIKGVLYAKDLLPYLDATAYDWGSLLRKPFFVPENKKLDDLLEEFQDTKIHMAIVVDEYGGVNGIVTLEDVLEEVVGDISDEFDEDDLAYSKLDEDTYLFEGKTSLKDFYRIMEADEDLFNEAKGEADSLSGFVLEVAGRTPHVGQEIQLGNYTFTPEYIFRKSIKRIKVKRLPST